MYHQFNAAVCCSEINNIDSTYAILERISFKQGFDGFESLVSEERFEKLKKDKRWLAILFKVEQNKKIVDKDIDLDLVNKLKVIRKEDGKYRGQYEIVKKKYGIESKELVECNNLIKHMDSINSSKVEDILDKYGWLGEKKISFQGNKTLALVIVHSRLSIQKKYLPMLKDAVKKSNALPEDLALLEDLIAVQEGRKQKYGTRVNQDYKTLEYFVEPLEDPDNVDKFREEVGLGPIAEYLKIWNIKWDIEQYKKDLPEIQKILNRDNGFEK